MKKVAIENPAFTILRFVIKFYNIEFQSVQNGSEKK